MGSVLEGSIESDDTGLLGGSGEIAVVSGEAEAKGELVLTTEEATLSGKLGAEVNLIEAGVGGDFYLTPRRIANPVINLLNYALTGSTRPGTPLSEAGKRCGTDGVGHETNGRRRGWA